MTTKTKLIEKLADRLETVQAAIKKLSADAAGGYLDGSETVFSDAAQLRVLSRTHHLLVTNEEYTVEHVYNSALTSCIRYAKYGHRSTSQLSNVHAAAEASCWADMVEWCGGVKEA